MWIFAEEGMVKKMNGGDKMSNNLSGSITGVKAKVKDCIEYRGVHGGAFDKSKTGGIPDQEFIIKEAKVIKKHNEISIKWEPVKGYDGKSRTYVVNDSFKDKVEVIADFINENKGKRLLEVLEMELP